MFCHSVYIGASLDGVKWLQGKMTHDLSCPMILNQPGVFYNNVWTKIFFLQKILILEMKTIFIILLLFLVRLVDLQWIKAI
jgi:hypothetical protein